MNREDYICAVNQYSDMVYRIAYNDCRSVEDAEDVMQNVFLKLYQCQKEFADEEYKKRWLIRVTMNECHSLFRSPWKRGRQEWEQTEMENHLVWQDSEQSEVFDAVMGLSEKYRRVVYLYYYEGYQAKEISDILQIRETTVQTRLMRAREQLRKVLGQEEIGYGRA